MLVVSAVGFAPRPHHGRLLCGLELFSGFLRRGLSKLGVGETQRSLPAISSGGAPLDVASGTCPSEAPMGPVGPVALNEDIRNPSHRSGELGRMARPVGRARNSSTQTQTESCRCLTSPRYGGRQPWERSGGMIVARINEVRWDTDTVLRFELRPMSGNEFPEFTAGAHIDLHLPNGLARSYSLLNSQTATSIRDCGGSCEPKPRRFPATSR